MIGKAVVEALQKFVPEENIHLQEPMAGHTTFRIGGPADCFLQLESEEQLKKVRRYLEMAGVPFFVVGNGSNLLVDDDGYRGVVAQVGPGMSRITVEGKRLVAQAGASMAQAARAALEQGLTGLEFASGIPGTVGGGVVMNAGAYGGEMEQVVEQVTVLDKNGEVLELSRGDMEFGYRTSVIKNRPFIVLEVQLRLKAGAREEIALKMKELSGKRKEKQPLEYPSAGSTFKRPEGYFAAKLIEEAVLRGFAVGGAQVSEKHCGFVVNKGGATASDVRALMTQVQQRVQASAQVTIEPEVIMLGFEE